MTETTERTAMLDALRKRLAEALGYTVAFDCTHWHVLTPEGYTLGWTVYEERAEGMFSAVLPDWPRNDGDALAVCLEICVSKSYGLHIEHLPDPLEYIATFTAGDVVCVSGSLCATPAEALARLALAEKGAGAGDE